MGGLQWLANNWFVALNAVGIIGGLLFTAVSLRSETKTRRITNLLILTQNHRAMWQELYRDPALARVLDPQADTARCPITCAEETFVSFVILHVNATYHTTRDHLTITPEGLRQDVRCFFSLPIPASVWKRLRMFQNKDFVRFVENALNSE